jgi:hypothetical protein
VGGSSSGVNCCVPCALLWRRRSIPLLSERAAEVQPGGGLVLRLAVPADRQPCVLCVGRVCGCFWGGILDMHVKQTSLHGFRLCGCGAGRLGSVLCLRRAVVAAALVRCVCVLLCDARQQRVLGLGWFLTSLEASLLVVWRPVPSPLGPIMTACGALII